MDLKKLKATSKELQPMLRIGKSAVNEAVVAEIASQLKKKRIIKIKILKAALSEHTKKEIIEKITEGTKSKLIDSVGNMITVYK